jgi:hypothetical protein
LRENYEPSLLGSLYFRIEKPKQCIHGNDEQVKYFHPNTFTYYGAMKGVAISVDWQLRQPIAQCLWSTDPLVQRTHHTFILYLVMCIVILHGS